MTSKLVGGILLIVGTSIGAGMLALPVTTAPGGFLGAAGLLFVCWLIMTFSALLILEVNLWLPRDSNIVSMAKMTLGRFGEVIAWVTYLLLLYSLIAAYISGGGDILRGLISGIHFNVPLRLAAILFLLVLGFVVYQGIKPIDYVNRFLMTTKLLAFFVLVFLIIPHIFLPRLETLHVKALVPAITVVITSFGFANIIPSLRSYFEDDAKKVRFAILVGSLIPLVCYLLWVGVILAEVPLSGAHGLLAMLTSSEPTTSLINSLQLYLDNSWLNSAVHLFTSICVATSFLGVALSLADFLADGLKIKKVGKGKILIHALTFLPPLIVVLFYPSAFITCLSYAGIFCVILLIMLPILMAWRGRYHQHIEEKYRVAGGKPLLIIMMIAAILIIAQNIMVSF